MGGSTDGKSIITSSKGECVGKVGMFVVKQLSLGRNDCLVSLKDTKKRISGILMRPGALGKELP